MENLSGRILEEKYSLIQPVGKGGMGAVYLARDLKLDTFWAIKAIENKKDSKIDLLAESNMLKKLEHPSLPRITNIITEDDYFFIVMDFIDGRTLDVIIREQGKIQEDTVVDWAKEICEVLGYLHNQDPPIIYRDMKPSNLMLTKDGRVKLIDFGIAREFKEEATADTTFLGTRGFAAPEQYKDSTFKSQTDERTDIYGLGVTLYNMLTGKRPDEPPYELKPLRQWDMSFSEGIEYIVAKCTQIDPALRYQNVAELMEDLVNKEKIGQEYELKKKKKIYKIVASATGIILSAALLVNGGWSYALAVDETYAKYVDKGIDERDRLEFLEAIESFEDAQKYRKNNKEGYYEVAKTYMSMWSLDKSLIYLNQQIQRDKEFEKDEYTQYLMGKAYFLKTNYQGALECFDKVKDAKKVDEDFQYLYGISKELAGNTDFNNLKTDVESLEKYIDKNSEDKLASLNLYMATADLYMHLSSSIDPKGKTNGDIQAEKQIYADRQIQLLNKAKQINPNEYSILDRLAMAYREKARNIRYSDEDEYKANLYYAQDLYLKCLDIQKSIDVYKNIGDIYSEMGEIEQAKGSYNDMIKLNPNNYQGYLKMASLYYEQNDINAAQEYMRQAEQCNYFKENDPLYIQLQKTLQ